MAKISKTKTHVKIYLTPLECNALSHIVAEGAAGLFDDDHETSCWSAAHGRVNDIIGPALRQAEEISNG